MDDIRQDDAQLDQAVVEAAVEATLRGWGDELYSGQKFWWMDWNRMILDVLTALRTGEPVAIDDYDEEDVRPSAERQIAIEAQDVRPA